MGGSGRDWRELGIQAGRALANGQPAVAAELFQQVVVLEPNHADSWFNLGYARRHSRDYQGALAAYARAIELGIAGEEQALLNRAAILSEHLNRACEAENDLRRAVARAPGFIPAWVNLGLLHEDRGDRDGARDAYRAALREDASCARAQARLAALDPDPVSAVWNLSNALGAGQRSPEDTAELEFALGNALDGLGRFEEAFAAVDRANSRMAAQRPLAARYDANEHERLVDALIASFPRRPTFPGHDSDRKPLFVCGMFRSGSTVAEQLLARHPSVVAGGELEYIPALVRQILQPYPSAAAALRPPALEELRGQYLRELERLAPQAAHVTDKRPDNFLHLALIKTLFPGALIVHTRRDPLDVAVSTYFLNFAESVSYSERLADIGHYLAQYRRLMAHWEAIFEQDLVTVDYERLVEDPAAALGPVYRALGLDPGLSRAGVGGGAIRTPSAWAARSPLHARSVGRWRHYERWLDPVRTALSR